MAISTKNSKIFDILKGKSTTTPFGKRKRRNSFRAIQNYFKSAEEKKIEFRRKSSMKSIEFWEV